MGALGLTGHRVAAQAGKPCREVLKCSRELNPKQYAALLLRCQTLEDGRRLHKEIIEKGHGDNSILGNILVHLYARCGCLQSSRQVFDEMGSDRNVITWNTMMAAYSKKGEAKQALELFKRMEVEPDMRSFTTAFGICATLKSLADGRAVHKQYTFHGFEGDVCADNSLISMYARCGSLEEARRVFDRMTERNVVSWNAIIAAYAKEGYFDQALQLQRRFDLEGLKTDAVSFIGILGACRDLRQGKEIHHRVLLSGFLPDVVLETALLNMYARCGSLQHAKRTFDSMQVRDVGCWNAMLAAYDQFGHSQDALSLYRRMVCGGLTPDAITYVVAVTACCSLGAVSAGKEVHARFMSTGLTNHIVSNALVNLHGKWGLLDDARKVFDGMQRRDVGSWNAIIGAYAFREQEREAVRLYRLMDVKPDVFTFTIVVGACSSLGDLSEAEKVHQDMLRCKLKLDYVTENSLVNMYAKCGSMEAAVKAFEAVQMKDVSCWNSLIAGYTQQSRGEEALLLFRKMELEGVQPNLITFINVITSCALSGATVAECKAMHARVVSCHSASSSPDYSVLGNAFISMFARRGSLEQARKVFQDMQQRNDGSWNTIIAAYAQHGQSFEALHLFLEMKLHGEVPCHITLCSVLLACSHAGLTDEAWYHFTETSAEYGIKLIAEHYHCMVDLLGRAGELLEAEQLMAAMPCPVGASGWRGLLNACKTHGEPALAAVAADRLSSMEPGDSSPYVLFSSLARSHVAD